LSIEADLEFASVEIRADYEEVFGPLN